MVAPIHICGLIARKAETGIGIEESARQFRVELLKHGVVMMRAKMFHAARGRQDGEAMSRKAFETPPRHILGGVFPTRRH